VLSTERVSAVLPFPTLLELGAYREVTPSGLLLTTTDVRMQKPNHLAHDPSVEIAWWILDSAIQLRITGKAYIVSADAATTRKAIQAMGVQEGEEGKNEWWQDMREQLWKDLSGHLRGSFGRPTPGTPLDQVKEKPEDWIQRLDPESVSLHISIVFFFCHPADNQDDPKQKKDIEFAKGNFAIIAVQPTGVEVLELKPQPNRRTQWTKQSDGSWSKVEVSP
jgi:pyridoxamine 5'-phosphate oxidase